MKTRKVDHRVQLAIKTAKARAGNGWAILGKDLQEALVMREVCSLILSNVDNPGHEKAGRLVRDTYAALDPDNYAGVDGAVRPTPDFTDPRISTPKGTP